MDNGFENIFEEEKQEEKIEILDVQDKPPKKKFEFNFKKDKVLTIQVILIVVWVLLTAIIYFFGYPLFEPFINV